MFHFRHVFGDGEVEAVKLFLTGDEIASGGARFVLEAERRTRGRRVLTEGVRTYL